MNWYGEDSLMSTLANWLEIVGFIVTVVTLLYALVIGSEVSQLKSTFLLDGTLPLHARALEKHAQQLSRLMNRFVANKRPIQTELRKLQTELESLTRKLDYQDGWHFRRFLWFVRGRQGKEFRLAAPVKSLIIQRFTRQVRRLFVTTDEDVWEVHARVHAALRHVRNLMENRANTLRR